MYEVKLISKGEEGCWFKAGTEVFDENTGKRFTKEEFDKWVGSGNIVARGIRVSEADGTEYEDSELCPLEEFDITIVEIINPEDENSPYYEWEVPF